MLDDPLKLVASSEAVRCTHPTYKFHSRVRGPVTSKAIGLSAGKAIAVS